MEKFSRFYASAVNKTVPPAVVLVTNGAGEELYHRAFGKSADENDAKPITTDSVFQFASCTKLITTMAALQCVDRGLLALDDDITKVLPELSTLQILDGFDEKGSPIFRARTDIITLRQLLTHSAGFYDDEESIMEKYTKTYIPSADRSVIGRWLRPLRYRPGFGWWYSGGVDWAGKAVERVNGNMRLGEYMQKNIFEPLGIRRLGFQLADRPDLAESLTQLFDRTEDDQIVPAVAELWPAWGVPDDLGGGGLYGTVEEFVKIQAALLKNDGSILRPETVKSMFQPQLPDPQYLKTWIEDLSDLFQDATLQNIPKDARINFGLGGLMNLDAIPQGRGPRTMSWGGAWNAVWWIDPENNIAGFYAAALKTYGDKQTQEASLNFVRAAYDEFVNH